MKATGVLKTNVCDCLSNYVFKNGYSSVCPNIIEMKTYPKTLRLISAICGNYLESIHGVKDPSVQSKVYEASLYVCH